MPAKYLSADADISACGAYRYRLTRVWDAARPGSLFVMINPSTADAAADDATIRKCVAFARSWGHGRLTVVNLFALRDKSPAALLRHADPVGPGNDAALVSAVAGHAVAVAGWGSKPGRLGRLVAARAAEVRAMLRRSGLGLSRLALCDDGQPGHPLFLPASLTPVLWEDG